RRMAGGREERRLPRARVRQAQRVDPPLRVAIAPRLGRLERSEQPWRGALEAAHHPVGQALPPRPAPRTGGGGGLWERGARRLGGGGRGRREWGAGVGGVGGRLSGGAWTKPWPGSAL